MGLNLKSIGAAAVRVGFSLTDGIAVAGVYHQITAGVYSPAAGTVVDTDNTATVSARLVSYDQKDVDGQNIRSGDQQILIKAAELVSPVEQPSTNDFFIETASAIRHDVLGVDHDPTGSLWILHTRRHTMRSDAAVP